jgi:hypothetical protein
MSGELDARMIKAHRGHSGKRFGGLEKKLEALICPRADSVNGTEASVKHLT